MTEQSGFQLLQAYLSGGAVDYSALNAYLSARPSTVQRLRPTWRAGRSTIQRLRPTCRARSSTIQRLRPTCRAERSTIQHLRPTYRATSSTIQRLRPTCRRVALVPLDGAADGGVVMQEAVAGDEGRAQCRRPTALRRTLLQKRAHTEYHMANSRSITQSTLHEHIANSQARLAASLTQVHTKHTNKQRASLTCA